MPEATTETRTHIGESSSAMLDGYAGLCVSHGASLRLPTNSCNHSL
jgi:hypothetical protein